MQGAESRSLCTCYKHWDIKREHLRQNRTWNWQDSPHLQVSGFRKFSSSRQMWTNMNYLHKNWTDSSDAFTVASESRRSSRKLPLREYKKSRSGFRRTTNHENQTLRSWVTLLDLLFSYSPWTQQQLSVAFIFSVVRKPQRRQEAENSVCLSSCLISFNLLKWLTLNNCFIE